MKIPMGDMIIYFPYDYVYPEQYEYMSSLKKTLDSGKGHCLLEMPTGTGKTVSLLSLIVSYQLQSNLIGKLIYCTRTVQEIDKVMQEIKRVFNYIKKEKSIEKDKKYFNRKNLCICLSARRNLCIHEYVSKFDDRNKIDSLCRNRTASWIRNTENVPKSSLCQYYEEYINNGTDADLEGIYSLDDLKDLGHKKKWCPYFAARKFINIANIVVYNYQYMLDPSIANLISKDLTSNSVVVFDEAHNIDNICIEALSVKIDKRTLHNCTRNLSDLSKSINDLEKSDKQRLNDEYQALINGLASDSLLGNNISDLLNTAPPVLSDDIVKESIPGNIRKAKHFVNFLKTFLEYLRDQMKINKINVENPNMFITKFKNITRMKDNQINALKFCHDRLHSLFRTLKISDLSNFDSISKVTIFATLIGTYNEGFQILIEAFDNRTPNIKDPILRLCCQDASIAIKPVIDKYRNIIITSGTLSPIDYYPKILNFNAKISKSFNMTLSRECICPIIVSKGNDQIPMTTKYESRSDPSVVKNYGELLREISNIIPDGVVCFFTSYSYMEEIVTEWSKLGILNNIMKNKLIFIETKDIVETSLALDSFKKACDCGRGAIFLSVARGKVAEGIDFDRHYGRCVILFGIPFQYSRSRVLLLRLDFLKTKFNIKENDFLAFDAMRQSAQCVGRVIRSKLDYGLMIFADLRYTKNDKKNKLPKWLLNHLNTNYVNLSTDIAISVANKFIKKMAQPHSKQNELGTSLYSLNHIKQKYKNDFDNNNDININNNVNNDIDNDHDMKMND